MKLQRSIILPAVLTAVCTMTGFNVLADETAKTNVRGLDRKNMDITCPPCEDFNQYANGGWMARNSIPEDYPFWSTSHEVLQRNDAIIREILDEAASSVSEHGSIAQKIGDLYFSGLDSLRAEKDGMQPIQIDLDRIDAILSLEDLLKFLNDHRREGVSFLFDAGALQDLEKSDEVILYLTNGGLSLPDRDYYTRQDEESVKLREQYVEHIARMLGLIGIGEAAAQAQAATVLNIETRLAEVTLTAVEKMNLANYYDIKTVEEAATLVPRFPFNDFLAAIGLPDLESFSLAPDRFFVEMNNMLGDVPLDKWKAYLRWQTVSWASPYLNSDLVNEGFRFSGKILSGQEELSPRWKRAKGAVSGSLGEALGRLYVERAFSPEAKARALEMVENLRIALREKIEGLEWMGPETKAKALTKLVAFRPKIGYPDKWKNYSSLETNRGSWIDNIRRVAQFAQRENLDKIGKPPDRGEWVTNPHTVNAFYHPLMNDITFPAGILQPPFFDVDIDDAINYGCMGVVIGHEMTHGFDNNGRRFDADGNMVDWWTAEDNDKFLSLAQRMIEQFDQYVVIDSLHVNGELTLGENIADRGGLRIAYRALQLAREGKEDPMIDGLTQEQRFFLSYAQFFRTIYSPEFVKMQVNTDPHAPNMYRIIGPLTHISEFTRAFGCGEGDKMYTLPDEQVHVW